MLTLSSVQRVYLACGSTDLRKSIDGLAVLVQEAFRLAPFSPCLCSAIVTATSSKFCTGSITVSGYSTAA
ncbi:IS66 family insertion sequence element accessory protein TnpB [Brevibacillus sp. SAFN-007a]|uniref:IS66 family insertion sequence element accessory protein TnpB n=1 Tax=Brevibacillus sp. SAFN-007a TaxID=3436862 RepID=UPI003F813963